MSVTKSEQNRKLWEEFWWQSTLQPSTGEELTAEDLKRARLIREATVHADGTMKGELMARDLLHCIRKVTVEHNKSFGISIENLLRADRIHGLTVLDAIGVDQRCRYWSNEYLERFRIYINYDSYIGRDFNIHIDLRWVCAGSDTIKDIQPLLCNPSIDFLISLVSRKETERRSKQLRTFKENYSKLNDTEVTKL